MEESVSVMGITKEQAHSLDRIQEEHITRPATKDTTDIPLSIEESDVARLDRLGRERPAIFKTRTQECGFVFAVIVSQIISEYYVSGFAVLIPSVASDLSIPAHSTTWPASAFSLVISTFLLPLGRIADMYGAYPVYIGGCAWTLVWSLIAGFSTNEIMLDVCRALQGFGPAAFLPASMSLLGSTYRPGPRKNLVFSLYGAMAPMGFFIGIFISCGIILVVFALTDSSAAPDGWATWYIIATLVVGLVLLAAAVYVEGWVAAEPLLPSDIFKVKYMKPLIVVLIFTYGSLGIFLLYATYYMSEIMGASPMQLVAWWTPAALGGLIIATVGGFVLHLVPGTLMIIIAGVAWIISPLLFALAPAGANYWAWVFPSMICCTVGLDITFNITNIFITTSMPTRRQGLAGALINSLLQLSIAVALGIGDNVVSGTAHQGRRQSLKNAFWCEVALAAVALIIFAGFVKVDKAKGDISADEKEALEVEKQAAAGRESAA